VQILVLVARSLTEIIFKTTEDDRSGESLRFGTDTGDRHG
jgi:hypothetical protein